MKNAPTEHVSIQRAFPGSCADISKHSGNLLESNLVRMKVRSIRPVLSTALSCWFGFLACLLGCVQPALPATHCEQQPSRLNPGSATSNTQESSPCCNHGSRSSGGQSENRHHSASCCPLDAALNQKQDSVSPFSSGAYVAVPVSVAIDFPQLLFDRSEAPLPAPFAARDILLQVHVLRI